jgi:glycine/D-amino acid oxidase-like deaminating enzyme
LSSGRLDQGAVNISELDPGDTEQKELHGGQSPWWDGSRHPNRPPLTADIRCDALVVGAGITGSLVAERLVRQGLNVVIVDREHPGRGSTQASTSMLLWEIDRPLTELTEVYGFERAARVYRASAAAVQGLVSHARGLDIPCDIFNRHSLYLATGDSGKDLMEEHRLRLRAGLPGEFLDHLHLLNTFGIARAAAIVSPGAADANPLRLARGMLARAIASGARLFDGEAVTFDSGGRSVVVGMHGNRQIEASAVVLATGYVMPAIVRSSIQQVSSSWAIATSPQPERVWRDGALIWEATRDYHYARTTRAGRIIIGGEDSSEIIVPDARDRLIPEKARALSDRLASLWPRSMLDIEIPLGGYVRQHSRRFTAGWAGPGRKRALCCLWLWRQRHHL